MFGVVLMEHGDYTLCRSASGLYPVVYRGHAIMAWGWRGQTEWAIAMFTKWVTRVT